MHLVEPEGDIERRSLGVAVLAGEIVEQLVRADGEVAHSAFEEVPGEGGLRRHDELGRLRSRGGLTEHLAEAAEALTVCALAGPDLGDGKAKHGVNVYLPRCSGISRSAARS